MSDRGAEIERFLARAGAAQADRTPLAGDASNRRYERLTFADGASLILMDAPPENGGAIAPFISIADHLDRLGLSPPARKAASPERGLLLLEDLGDALFARLLEADPGAERRLYLAATDVLIALHAAPTPTGAPPCGPSEMTRAAAPAFDWYGAKATGRDMSAERAAMQSALSAAFAGLPPWGPVLNLRDYHAENLFWLPSRAGNARVGLIDFQDACIGHPAYDLASLGRDVRRDVSPETYAEMLAHYCARTGQDVRGFEQAAATLSAQRNLRILGVFTRLALRDRKRQYIDLIPRTWANLMRDLAHPALADLREVVVTSLPAPDASLIQTLKDRCA